MDTSVILEMKSCYNQLTKVEKKVADYVLTNQRDVIYMSIMELADACEVGETSVYRFCRSLNLQGYQEFKMKLSMCQTTEDVKERKQEYIKSLSDMAQIVMEFHMQAIRETYQMLNHGEFEKVVEMLGQARRVYFFGVGSSLLTAEEACTKFLRITNKVFCVSDSHMQAMAAATAGREDLIVFLSYSGATKDNIEVAKIAKNAGVKIACISHFQKSPLTAYCDVVLLCGSKEGPLEGGSMAAKLGQLYLIDLLYQEYYRQNYEECKRNNEKTSEAVVDKLY